VVNKILKSIVISGVFLSPLVIAEDDFKAFDITRKQDSGMWVESRPINEQMSHKQKETEFTLAAKTLMANHQSFGDVVASIEFVDDKQESIFDIGVSISQQYPAVGTIQIGGNIIESIKTSEELKGLAAFALTKLSAVRMGIISNTGRYHDEHSKQTDNNLLVLFAGSRLEAGPDYFPVNYGHLEALFAGQGNLAATMILAATKKLVKGEDVENG
jgi:hypothetical protein